MPDYQNGKIYKLVSNNDPDLVYYGSTTQPLCVRKAGHIRSYRQWKNGKGKDSTTSYNVIEAGNVDIVLVEMYPCESKEELHKRERFWIDGNECVNKVIPTRNRQEWLKANKEQLKEKRKQYREANEAAIRENQRKYWEANKDVLSEYSKTYREANKEALAEKRKVRVECECGLVIRKCAIARHKRSDQHMRLMKNV